MPPSDCGIMHLRQFFLDGKWNARWCAEDGPRLFFEFNFELHITETSQLWLEKLAELEQITARMLQMSIGATRSLNCQQFVIRLSKGSFRIQQFMQRYPHGSDSITTEQIQIGDFGYKK